MICLLDDDSASLANNSRLLASMNFRTQPFCDPNALLRYAEVFHPRIAIVDFGGSHAGGLEMAKRIKEVSPATRVIISLKVHRGERARDMLSGKELTDLIAHCIEQPQRGDPIRQHGVQTEEVGLDRCA